MGVNASKKYKSKSNLQYDNEDNNENDNEDDNKNDNEDDNENDNEKDFVIKFEDIFKKKFYNYNYFNGYATCQINSTLSNIFNVMENLLKENLIIEYSIQESTLNDVIQNL